MLIDTTNRSNEIEIMDDFDMSGEILTDSLDKLANINKWLGGNKITIDGIKAVLKNHPKDKVISIIDLGCGNGDMLIRVADFGRKNGFKFQLLGLDANQATIDYAIQLSGDYPEISYGKEDVLSKEFQTRTYDIALCTLFLHHFEDEVALGFIRTMVNNSKIGVVINDLHRHPMAYYLFTLLSLTIKNHMVKSDGLKSILKGFKRIDLERFSDKLNVKSTISWRWAFRYQWIISKT
ncbi:MAG: 2-polyprenyl-3-methyl-5-hydroxy-6-metoxy-1,4-benzoquinol methylase [Salibacteraceae bacterium]|jgi:2-polyprenyl-3-methyl-5-hydroxy-6-metoxy-1,4-benzoquinol methylase